VVESVCPAGWLPARRAVAEVLVDDRTGVERLAITAGFHEEVARSGLKGI
jgi:hypothetical protein